MTGSDDGRAPTSLAPPPAEIDTAPDWPSPRRRWPGRLAAVTAVAVAIAATAWWAGAREPRAGAAASQVRTSTTPVVRRTLRGSEKVDGTLGFGDSSTLGFGRAGTVTWLPGEGATIKRGGTAYRVDDEPVPLLYGTLPAYRDLAAGVADGRDVTQLERNLKALGYDPGTVDDHFSRATRAALKQWQRDRGVDRTGAFRRGDAAIAPGPVRVAARVASIGAPAAPGQPALKVTATTGEVSIDLPADKQALVHVGDPVSVTLPSGRTAAGKVGAVSRVATTSGDDQPGQEATTTVGVTVTLDDPRSAGALDQAPVRVAIGTETRKDVLAVPVYALLALAEGGYAVEVDGGGSRHLVPVKAGLFADGLVEVTPDGRGGGLRAGMRVVVPA